MHLTLEKIEYTNDTLSAVSLTFDLTSLSLCVFDLLRNYR